MTLIPALLRERDEQHRFREEMQLKITLQRDVHTSRRIEGIYSLPGLLSPFFTGREAQCDLLGHLLAPAPSSQKRAAVYGMPGVGKTQLALRFAATNKHQFDNIFWVSGASYEKLSNGFQEIAELLDLPEKSRSEPQHVKVQAVKKWLTSEDMTRRWLLVMDNVDADDYKAVLEFIPEGPNGCILFTTRKSGAAVHLCGDFNCVVELKEMDPEESCALFLRVLGPGTENRPNDASLAAEIVKDMGNLPLAIDQVAAHARIMECSLEEYREMYLGDQSQALSWNEVHSSSSASVMHTFDRALGSLEGKFPNAGKLVCLFAFCDPEGIPLSILMEGAAGTTDKELQAVLRNKMSLEATLAQLKSVSLIRRVGEKKKIWMHDLFHLISRLRLTAEDRKRWASEAVALIWAAYDRIPFHWTAEFTNWDKNDEYLPHILSGIRLARDCGVDDSKPLAMMMERTTGYFIHRGRDDKNGLPYAVELGEQAVEVAKKAFGNNDPAVMKAMSTLGYVFKCTRRSKEAEAWNQRAFDLRNKMLGPKHPETLGSMFDLARDFRDQGRLDEAEKLWRVVLRERGIFWGEDHNETLWTMYMVAEVCLKKYDAPETAEDTKAKLLAEAEDLFVKAIVGFEKNVGRNHAFTLICLRSLALAYVIQERYLEAKQLLEEAVEGFVVIMGIDHVECEVTFFHLKRLYIITDLPEEVERLKRVFEGSSWLEEHEERGEVTQILHNN